MSHTLNGIITIKDGKVTHLKNITDLNAAIVDKSDPQEVLRNLFLAGWKLDGNYELTISKTVSDPEGA